jgi:hypothetical protein
MEHLLEGYPYPTIVTTVFTQCALMRGIDLAPHWSSGFREGKF